MTDRTIMEEEVITAIPIDPGNSNNVFTEVDYNYFEVDLILGEATMMEIVTNPFVECTQLTP